MSEHPLFDTTGHKDGEEFIYESEFLHEDHPEVKAITISGYAGMPMIRFLCRNDGHLSWTGPTGMADLSVIKHLVGKIREMEKDRQS